VSLGTFLHTAVVLFPCASCLYVFLPKKIERWLPNRATCTIPGVVRFKAASAMISPAPGSYKQKGAL